MKKLSSILGSLTLIALLALFAGCPTADEAIVTVTITPNDSLTTVMAGDSVSFVITLSPDGTNKGEVASLVIAEGSDVLVEEAYTSTSVVTYDFTYKVAEGLAEGTTIDLSVEAKDASGQPTIKSINLVVGAPALTVYANQKMTAQADDHKMLFNMTDGALYMPSEVSGKTVLSADIDLVFIHQDQDAIKYSLYSPSDDYVYTMGETYGSWLWSGTRNVTKIEKDNTLDPATITAAEIEALTVSGTSVNVLATGDVLKFETTTGRKGVILIGETADSKVKGAQTMFVEVTITPASSATTK